MKQLISVEYESVPEPVLEHPHRAAFVLSGGGNLGALQVGMLYALLEDGIEPSLIVGTSVGAINGAFLASRPDLRGIGEIAGLWSSLRRRDVLGLNAATLLRGLLGRRGHLFDSVPLRRVVESLLGFQRLEDAPIPFAVVATELATGDAVILDSGDATSALLASSAVPGILPPVRIGDKLLVDGAAAADIPLHEAVSLGAHDVYVLSTAPAQVAKALARCDRKAAAKDDSTKVHILMPPEVYIPLGDLDRSSELIDVGYDHARAWIEGRAPRIAPRRACADRRRPDRRRAASSQQTQQAS